MATPLTEEERRKQERDKYVRLISAEGVDFYVERKAACVSNTIKQMLGTDSGFIEGEKGEISFPEISTPILEKVCQYFYFKLRYQNTFTASRQCWPQIAPQRRPTKSIPEFAIPPEYALELLKASNYLDT